MKEMKLTRKGQEHIVMFDDDDYDLIMKYSWRITCGGYVYGYIPGTGIKRRYVNYWMHRVVLGLGTGRSIMVDHINFNKLDNRKTNLRVCTPQENTRHKRKNFGSSMYKGVTRSACRRQYVKKNGHITVYEYYRWEVKASTGGRKSTRLGFFKNEEDAARAYNNFAKQHFGEFAVLNIIE